MQIDLRGRTALVTGSTQGIGSAIAVGLARAGARVGVNGRSRERVEERVAELARKVPGAEWVPVAADVTTREGADRVAETLPAVDILVNNLGIFGAADPLEISDEEWRRYFEVNVLSAVRLTRLFLPGMTGCGWGRVQYIASDSAIVTPAEMIHYGMSKTVLLAVSRGFAKQTAGTGVTVNSSRSARRRHALVVVLALTRVPDARPRGPSGWTGAEEGHPSRRPRRPHDGALVRNRRRTGSR